MTETAVSQTISYWPLFVGPIIGLCSFCIGVVTLEGVLIRKDSTGKKKLRLDNLWQYIKLPFDSKSYETAWALIPGISFEARMKLLNLNWVAMVGLGALGSFGYYYLKYLN